MIPLVLGWRNKKSPRAWAIAQKSRRFFHYSITKKGAFELWKAISTQNTLAV
jgi:hypothetical protein